MGSTRALLGSAFLIFAAAGCSAGTGDTNAGGHETTGGNGTGGSMGPGFAAGGGGASQGGCSAKNCVGSTPQGNCDEGLSTPEGTEAMDGARAIGLCQVYSDGGWGVKSADWVRSDGQPLTGALLDGKGILHGFGPNQPREGSAMLVLSSGAARSPSDPGFQDPAGYDKDDSPHGSPPGYPKESPSCPGVVTGDPHDSAGLRLVIQTPVDAKSLSFNLNFYTYEYPDYICSTYNDFFVAMMNPIPTGLPDGNISFDPQGNTISVNAGFLDACTPSNAGGKNFSCSQGYSLIPGTGFESNIDNCGGVPFDQCDIFGGTDAIPGSAATGWLETKAPIEQPGGEITLQFAIWDSGDSVLDSTVLIDNFRFELDTTTTGTQPVPE